MVNARQRHAMSYPAATEGALTALAVREAGEEIIITRAGQPVAKLVALTRQVRRRRLGLLDGRFKIPDDFNAPLPEIILGGFEGRKKWCGRPGRWSPAYQSLDSDGHGRAR